MLPGQYTSRSGKQSGHVRDQHPLLKRHPVLLPLLLLLGACLAGIASFSTGNVFPLLTLIGLPSNVLCLSIALVLGISGILVGIIGIIECIDRRSIQATLFSKAKEQKL
jgi:hypothetical protein